MSIDTTQLPFAAKSENRLYLHPHEVDALIQAAKQIGRHGGRDAAMILMMFRHGLRSAELVALKWWQVDLKGGYIDIIRAKRGNPSKHPLRGAELRALRQMQRDYPDTQYVFISELKAPLTTRTIRAIVARAGEAAALPFPVHPHMLRHACGYYLTSQGQDTRAIQDYLGHKNIHHTVRYTQLSPRRFENFWQD